MPQCQRLPLAAEYLNAKSTDGDVTTYEIKWKVCRSVKSQR